jgi:hypothetical protein
MIKSIDHPSVEESTGGGLCPEQHYGHLMTGEAFYLRLRHGNVQLHLGLPGESISDLPASNPDWEPDPDGPHVAYQALCHPSGYWRQPYAAYQFYDNDNGWFESDKDRVQAFDMLIEALKPSP